MKKLLLSILVASSLVACGDESKEGDSEGEESSKNEITAENYADEFCECTDEESYDAIESCLEDLDKKYAELKNSDVEPSEEVMAKIEDCAKTMTEKMMEGMGENESEGSCGEGDNEESCGGGDEEEGSCGGGDTEEASCGEGE